MAEAGEDRLPQGHASLPWLPGIVVTPYWPGGRRAAGYLSRSDPALTW
jgi:hypothetical protein